LNNGGMTWALILTNPAVHALRDVPHPDLDQIAEERRFAN
jgi:hypothetical protein